MCANVVNSARMATKDAIPSAQNVPTPFLSVAGVSLGYGKAPVLDAFSIDIPAGKTVSVIGPNGAGKSTLLKGISGLLKLRQGSIQLAGKPLSGLSPSAIARSGVLHVPENRDVFGGMTVW